MSLPGARALAFVCLSFAGCGRGPDAAVVTEPKDAAADRVLASPSAVQTELPLVLYVHRWSVYRHEVLEHSADVLRDLGAGRYRLEVVDDAGAIDRAKLPSYAAIAMFVTGESAVRDDEKQPLLDFVRQGGGFAALHSCSDAMRAWPEWTEMIGARFEVHPWHDRVTVNVVDRAHPATEKLPPAFSLFEEIYQFREILPGSRVLLELDTRSVDMTIPGVTRHPWGFPLAWSRSYGRGKVFYTALGHGVEAWDDPSFREHVKGGVESVLR